MARTNLPKSSAYDLVRGSEFRLEKKSVARLQTLST
jgi:hypothetical protein